MSQQNNGAWALYMYVIVITVISGAALSVVYNALEPMHTTNKEVAKKAAILSCIPEYKTIASKDAEAVFNEKITILGIRADGSVVDSSSLAKLNDIPGRKAVVYNKMTDMDLGQENKVAEELRVYPLYVYTAADASKMYIVSVRGSGLWDAIWAYVALKPDLSTIAGVYFDHKGETPGLGAEIKDSEAFKAQFLSKKIFENGDYKSIVVKKKSPKGDHEIQSISGATVTSDGVGEMMVRGVKYYLKYFATLDKTIKVS
jgi:Na+-transporting NADH:ubiquinone oxidoreductase subunit C